MVDDRREPDIHARWALSHETLNRYHSVGGDESREALEAVNGKAAMRTVSVCLVGMLLLASAIAPIGAGFDAGNETPVIDSIELRSPATDDSPWPWRQLIEDTQIPESVTLTVPLIAQNPELPNGCEVTSLTMLLQYLGYDIDHETLAFDYMPQGEVVWTDEEVLVPNPETTYVGNPADFSGFYILVPGLVETANAYLRERDTGVRGINLTGIDRDGISKFLAQGMPVVTWVTMGYDDVDYLEDVIWTIGDTGEMINPYGNLHCVLVIGYDSENVIVNNPLEDTIEQVPWDEFMHSFDELGDRAMTVVNTTAIG